MYKPQVSTEVLPPDALSTKDQLFYALVERLTSSEVSEILKIQRINSVNTFLLCKNIPESILLPSKAFNAIREATSAKLDLQDDDSYVVHIGIIGQIDYLTELFRKKQLQCAKSLSKDKCSTRLTSAPDNLPSTSTNPISTNDSAISNHSTTLATIPTVTKNSTVVSVSSATNDARSKIIRIIDKWVISQKKETTTNNIQLVDGVHYSLQLSALYDAVTMICQCKTRILIHKNADGGYSLSNVYKHWKTSKKCDTVPWFKTSCSSPSHSLVSSIDNVTDDENDDDDCSEDSNSPSKQSARPTNRLNNKRLADSTPSASSTSLAKRRRQ